jgi:hypothetical protein
VKIMRKQNYTSSGSTCMGICHVENKIRSLALLIKSFELRISKVISFTYYAEFSVNGLRF